MSPTTQMALFALSFLAASAQVVTIAPTTAATDDGCADGLCDTTPYIRKLWMAHGILMLLGFVIIMPCAICASLLRKYFPAGHVWFTVHRFLNWSAVIMMITGFSIAVYIKQITQDFPHFALDSTHRATGLSIFILIVIQATLGFFRPHLPKVVDDEDNDDAKEEVLEESFTVELAEESGSVPSQKRNNAALTSVVNGGKSTLRLAWEICHRFFGLVILALGWWNCYSGMEEFESAEDVPLFANNETVLLTLIGSIGGMLLLLFSAKTSRVL